MFRQNFHGILVPGGFGKEGSLGKINAIKYAKIFNVPFLGICFGMQLAVIESLRNLKGYEKSSSTEFGKTDFPSVSCLCQQAYTRYFALAVSPRHKP